MEEHLQQFQQEKFHEYSSNKYLDEHEQSQNNTGEIEDDELFSIIQGTQPNSNHFNNNNSVIQYNDRGQEQNNFHSYESPSSTTTSMEQRLEQTTPNIQQFRVNTTNQFQQINREQKLDTQTNQTMSIPTSNLNLIQTTPTSTQNFIQALPIPSQKLVQGLFHIQNWQKIELPGQVVSNLVKTNHSTTRPTSNTNPNQWELTSPGTINHQTQWQQEEASTPNIEKQKIDTKQCNLPVPVVIDNQHPFKIDDNIISQIQDQAAKQGGVRQMIKIRSPDPTSETQPLLGI